MTKVFDKEDFQVNWKLIILTGSAVAAALTCIAAFLISI